MPSLTARQPVGNQKTTISEKNHANKNKAKGQIKALRHNKDIKRLKTPILYWSIRYLLIQNLKESSFLKSEITSIIIRDLLPFPYN